jgi:hypothetical protein
LAAVAESPSAVPALPGLAVPAVEWLPSGAESGLVRVRGRWTDESAVEPDLPVLALLAGGAEHRFDSLPDARFSREPSSWRGTYLVPAELVAVDPELLWLEWPSGARAGLPPLSRGVEPPPVPAAPERPEEPDEPGGQVIDRAVLAERRARRAEAAEASQARVAAEALKAVEVLELRSAELERRLEEATAERDALAEPAERREALEAALASAAELRARSREWQLRLRTTEVGRAGDAVRLAMLEAERATGMPAMRTDLADARREVGETAAELEAARREAGETAAELEAARSEAAGHAAALAAATDAAASARADLDALDARFAEAHAAWDRRRAELEAALSDVRAQLATARDEAGLREGEATEARADAEALRERIGSLEAALAVADSRIQSTEADLKAAETRLGVERVARTTLEDQLARARRAHAEAADRLAAVEAEATERLAAHSEAAERLAALEAELAREHAERPEAAQRQAALEAELERERAAHAETADRRRVLEAEVVQQNAALGEAAERRAALQADLERERTARSELAELRTALDAEREARRVAEEALAAARAEAARTDTTLQQRIAELERRAAAAPELERVAREHAAPAHEPTADTGRLVADLDAAAEALRRRGAPETPTDPAPPVAETGSEPPAPDAEPGVEWAEPLDEPPREPCVPAVEPARPRADPDERPPWMPPGFEPAGPSEAGEPPAPDAEPAVESAPPVEPEPPEAPQPPEPEAPPADASAAPLVPVPEVVEPAAPPIAVPEVVEPARPSGPIIVPAPGPPARALATGSHRREYPLLRGALVKLAHDDPATAAALLVALMPAQGVAIEGPLAYDLTIREAGTFAVAIAGGRASVEQIDFGRPRGIADFHLTADSLVLSELLAGVEHRVGRFFGPARFRGRKRRLKELQALPVSTASLADAARAGARLDPGLVYRLLAYAIHPTWTRGHDFTIAQAITGAPPETWYLTVRDGAGISVSANPPAAPDATVEMSRETFDRLLRHEPVGVGSRPIVHGDHGAVAAMHGWTQRAQGIA